MPSGGLLFEKDVNPVSRRIERLFEGIRAAYLSARQDPKEYGKEWMKEIVDDDHTSERLKKVSKKAIRYYDRLIKICHKYKHQPAVNDKWLNKYLNKKYPKGVTGGVLGIKGKIYPTTEDYYKLLKQTKGDK